MTDPLLLTVEAAGALLSIKRATMYKVVARGLIPCVRIGTLVRISRADLEAYVASLSTGSPATPVALGNPRAKALAGMGNGALIPGPGWIARQKGKALRDSSSLAPRRTTRLSNGASAGSHDTGVPSGFTTPTPVS